jgi:glycosyltransferase involved in cell wall biosynthesis
VIRQPGGPNDEAPAFPEAPASQLTLATPGVRVVLDVRPLQEPDRAPTTAIYLGQLLAAFAARPLSGESFALMLQAGLTDPTEAISGLAVIGRRLLPPTRLLRSGAMTVDPFLLRGASLGAGWRAERGGAAGAVYHAVGGVAPLASGLPVVVTVLDLAPWERPDVYLRSPAARFGHRLRTRIMRDAAAIVVGSEAVARSTRSLLRLRRDKIRVVPLAARDAFDPAAREAAPLERRRLGLPERYLVYPGRFDARQDLVTLLAALRRLVRIGRPRPLDSDLPWPPRVLLVGASPADRAALARSAARHDVGELLLYAPLLEPGRLAAVVAGARAAVLPMVSDASAFAAIEALAAGTPVIASAVGALPEAVGSAGILVEPRDAERLASALATLWTDDEMHARFVTLAEERSSHRRTWSEVADETRRVYAEVATRPSR